MDENETAIAAAIPTPRLTFKVEQFIDAKIMRHDLQFSPNALTDAMMTQASMFAHYGVLTAKASRQVDTIKLLLEAAEGAAYRVVREDYLARGEKSTEALLEKMVSRDSKVVATKKALIEAKQIEAIGKTATEAFRHRRDMLVQQGLLSREEMKGEISVAQKNAREIEAEQSRNAVLERRRVRLENE